MSDTESHTYVEQSLQLAAINWLSDHCGYDEVMSDEMAIGDRVDSVGLMHRRTVLIEVKPTVNAGMSKHVPHRPGTIESKTACTLKDLHEGSPNHLSTAIRSIWSPEAPPVFALLAGHYSKGGLTELIGMLERRSPIWLFDYRVWRWSGHEVEELAAGNLLPPPAPDAYSQLAIERLTGRSRRQPPRSRDQLRAIARANGVGELLDHGLRLAEELGYRISRTRGNFALERPADGERTAATVVSFYVEDASPLLGMNAGCWSGALEGEAITLPGIPAPRKGFLNTNRYLRTNDEVSTLLRLFAAPAQKD